MKSLFTFVIALTITLNLAAQDVELPFFDDFSNNYENWTIHSISGGDVWHLSGDDGIGGSKCARFYRTEYPPEVNDDWLVLKEINTEGTLSLAIDFKYLAHSEGLDPQFYYSTSFTGDVSSTNWNEIDNSFWKNNWSWNNFHKEIETPGNTFVFAIRYQSTTEDAQYILIDNFEVTGFKPVSEIKTGETEHFEFYTNNAEYTDYWLEIKDRLEEQFDKYPNYWSIPGAPDYIEPNTKTKIYLFDRENIRNISANTPDWKLGFYTWETNSIYLDNSILQLPETSETYQYYNGVSGLAVHTFVAYALQLILNRDADGFNLPEYVAEGFGLYERGYRPNRDSIIAFKEKHPEFVDDVVMYRFTDYPTTSEKDIAAAFAELNILFGGYRHCNYWSYEWIPQGWEKFLYYFYTTPTDTELIKKYEEGEFFDFYCSSQDTMFIESMKVWLNQTRNYYVDSFEMELNIQVPMVIVNQKTGADLTGSPDFNGGSGNLNISPHDFWGGIDDGYDWLLSHEVGHVFNDYMCFAEPYYSMPFGFYHEGMANFSGYNIAGGEHRDDLWKIDAVFNIYQQKFNREPTLDEFINDPDTIIDCYFFGFEFFRYLRKIEGYLKIKEFFINKMDFSVFSVSYDDLEQGYIDYLKSLNDLNYPELTTNNGIVIERGDTAVITTENLSACDKEAKDDGLFFEISEPLNGHIAKIDNPGNPITKFSMQDLKQEKIIYVNDSTSATSDSFLFTITDEVLTAGVFQFDITLTNPTAISEFEYTRKNQLEIYPNPITNETIISFQTKTSGKVDLSVFDIQGRKVYTFINEKLNAGKHTIPVSKSLPANGIYFCKLTTAEGISTKKIIIDTR